MKSINLKSILFASTLAFGSIVFNGCNKDDDDNNTDKMYTISGTANGSQMSPSVTGTGTADITGTYSAKTNVLTYTSTWTGLTGAPTSAAFYSGTSGVNGAIVGSSWALGSGLTGTGTFSGTITLTDAEETQLLAGGLYYTYNTTAHASGEVRGQITASPQ